MEYSYYSTTVLRVHVTLLPTYFVVAMMIMMMWLSFFSGQGDLGD